MSQMDRLPKIKRIELTAKAMRPPEGSKAVDTMPDGTPIYEGPVFAGNPWFKNHEDPKDAKNNGHARTPVMDPMRPGEQKWKKNKATGEGITPVFKNRRVSRIVRFIMADDGNGSAGPRPVPGLSAQEQAHRTRADGHDNWLKEFTEIAQAEGLSPAEALAALKAQAAPAEPKRGPGRPKKVEEVSVDG